MMRDTVMDAIIESVAAEFNIRPRQLVASGDAHGFARKVAVFVAKNAFAMTNERIQTALYNHPLRVGLAVVEIGTKIGNEEDYRRQVQRIITVARRVIASRMADEKNGESKPVPVDNEGLSISEIAEVHKLRAKGFSVKALAKRLNRPERVIAPLVGVAWGESANA